MEPVPTAARSISSDLDPNPSALSMSTGTPTSEFEASTPVDGYTRSTGSLSQSDHDFGAGKEEYDSDDQFLTGSLGELMFSFYLPMIFVWARRCMFGTANLVHSLIVGHFLRLAVGLCSAWTPPWLRSLVSKQASHGKMDPHACPPPALAALALLTVFALVVHPDGLTWILFDKLRGFANSTCHVTTQHWELLVQDYGILTSIAALLTIATLLFLVFVIQRTLSPRKISNSGATSSEKKKKKRRSNARHRGSGGGARIKSLANSHGTAKGAHSRKSQEEALALSEKTTRRQDTNILIPVSPEKNDTSMQNGISISSSCGQDQTNEKENERKRVPSVSTIDTTTLSDDLSCGSASVRSLPSGNTPSTMASTGDLDAHPVKGKGPPASSRRPKRGGRARTTERHASHGNGKSSRWDALRPDQNVVHNHNQHNHQQVLYHNKCTTHYRQKGRGGGRGHKKGRRQQEGSSSTSPCESSPQLESDIPDLTLAAVQSAMPTTPPQFSPSESLGKSRHMLPGIPSPPPGLGPLGAAPGSAEATLSSVQSIAPPSLPPTLQRSVGSIDTYPRLQQYSPVVASSFGGDFTVHREWQKGRTDVNQCSPPASPFAVQFVSQPHTVYGNVVKENPFADSSDSQIEAELQELGGQMAGSILDF